VPKNLVSIFAGHDANITFYNGNTDKYHIIELERITKQRYFRLHVDNSKSKISEILKTSLEIANDHWGIENDFEVLLINSDGWVKPKSILRQIFQTKKIMTLGTHHQSHAATAFFQSPFSESLIISFDGGGDDGFFNIYLADRSKLELIKKIDADFGGGYLLFASLIREVSEKSKHQLSLAGKMMGLCAYGKVDPALIEGLSNFYINKRFIDIIDTLNLPFNSKYNPWSNPLKNWVFQGENGYNLAATAQASFEKAFLDICADLPKNLPICVTGGAALNVILNQTLKDTLPNELFVPPNPNDCGLSLGHMFLYTKPQNRINVSYSGVPLLDIDILLDKVDEFGAKLVTMKDVARLLKSGKIIGFVYGDSEVGPRALGHRSILCDPSIENMKDVINKKVKFREWYRPFAPVCRLEDAEKYFDSTDFMNMEYMSYAPRVKMEWKSKLSSITHVDGTARLQTVTKNTNKILYKLISEFSEISETAVLLNTSFNIRGLPILTTIEDALHVLNSTDLDCVVIENYLFEKVNIK
jgi:carbamoyltransferase